MSHCLSHSQLACDHPWAAVFIIVGLVIFLAATYLAVELSIRSEDRRKGTS